VVGVLLGRGVAVSVACFAEFLSRVGFGVGFNPRIGVDETIGLGLGEAGDVPVGILIGILSVDCTLISVACTAGVVG
jgi:hypothetical protein